MSGLDIVIDVVSWALVIAGSAFLVIGAIGLIRMPDVFTRMHAASVSDTAGAGLLITAMILQAGFSLVSAKLLFIAVIFFFAGPVATHALARAALSVGVEPVLFGADGRRRRILPADLAEVRGRTDEFVGSGPTARRRAGASGSKPSRKPARRKGGKSSKR